MSVETLREKLEVFKESHERGTFNYTDVPLSLSDFEVILAHLQPSPDVRGLVEQWLTDEGLIDLSGPKTRKPTHGRCCTCQDCGFSHDDCECDRNERTVRWRTFIEAALATTPEPK